jgi:hypothetical protein
MNDRSNVLAQLARAVAGSEPDGPLPLRMCRACVSLLGVDGGSITLAYDAPQRVTLCSTDRIAEQMEDLHEVIGEGPSLWAYEHGTAVSTAVDGAADERWPQFAESVKREIGRISIYAIPIIPQSEVVGVSTFYRRHQSSLLIDDETCRLLINAVGVALLADPDLTDDGSSGSWASRDKVSQATGMVMAQLGLRPEDALALLRAHAYADNTSLNEVSQAVIERRLDFVVSD